jgi:hypothetical protein
MMLGSASLDALQRIADRANDVLAAYTPGAFPLRSDVAAPGRPLAVDDPLSVAAAPGTWFVTTDARGERAYTRAGTFHAGDDGTLRAADGAQVLGANGGIVAPLKLPEPDFSLGRCAGLRIDGDGTLSYERASIDPRNRERRVERIVAGRVALARFPAGSAPQRVDATHFNAPAGVTPYVGFPAQDGFAPLAPAMRDTGSIDIDAGLQRLTDAYVAFSALQTVHRAQVAGDRVVTDLVK